MELKDTQLVISDVDLGVLRFTHYKTYCGIIELSVRGRCVRTIARELNVPERVVRYVQQEESRPIAERKAKAVRDAMDVAEMAVVRIKEELAEGTIHGRDLVPAYGVAIDKVQMLSGDPALVIRHEHAHVVEHHLKPLSYREYLAQIEDKPASDLPVTVEGRTVDGNPGDTQRLSLTEGSSDSE